MEIGKLNQPDALGEERKGEEITGGEQSEGVKETKNVGSK